MQHIKNAKNLKGSRVIVRAELNVPIKNGKVADDFRIKKAVQTIQWLKKQGAHVIVIGHIGRGEKYSLKPVAQHMQKYTSIGFVPQLFGEQVEGMVSHMKDGTALMLENARKYTGEEKNEVKFAKKIARLGDLYVNDAFSVSHRKHATIVQLPKLLPAYAGFLLAEEIEELSRVFKPKHPFLFILGGAKFQTKIPLINTYSKTADYVFVGGALAHNFFDALGFEIGRSKMEAVKISLTPLLKKDSVLLPVDVVAVRGSKETTRPSGEVRKTEKIVDAGPETVAELTEHINKAKLIVLNGPLGFYEKGYDTATKEILRTIAKSKAVSIIGGGDTARLVSQMNMHKKFTFVSTGGGAMIQFLAEGTLPGIKELESKK